MTHVINLTDIDDRILDQAMHAGTTIAEYVKPYVAAFFEDMSGLRAQPAGHFPRPTCPRRKPPHTALRIWRSEEHTSELQSPHHLVFRLLPLKKKNTYSS